ncbi:MAG: hypothetical protein WAU42_14395 [Solirubrobacteraceae bacterium]
MLVALTRGGWRHWRGLAAFVAVALVIGAPWYIDHFSELSTITRLAGTESGAVAGNQPPTLSVTNLLWYFWSTLNSQLFALMFAFVLGGTLWTVLAILRREEARGPRLEFLVGGLVAWLAITLTPHHDIRYDMPLMPYLAVIGTGWIVHLSRVPRLLAASVLVLARGSQYPGNHLRGGETGGSQACRLSPKYRGVHGPDRAVFKCGISRRRPAARWRRAGSAGGAEK